MGINKRPVRDKKKGSQNGEVIKERTGLPRTKLPVKLPDNPTWLKQPNLITMLSADLNTLHLRVLISIIEKLQSSIDQLVNGAPFQQLNLFQQTVNDRIIITIPTKDFGVNPDNYPELRKALLQLASIPVELDTKDPITGAESWAVSGLFKAYIPKEKHRRTVSFEFDNNIAIALVDVERGFTKYIKEIAFQTQSKYTIRIYMLISSWKDRGGFSITLDRFRRWLKLGKKYPRYKDLYKRIIRPVYEELFEKANCWFEVAEVYKNGETDPFKLNFKVVRAALTFQEEEYLKTQSRALSNMLSYHFKMGDKQIKEVLAYVTIFNVRIAINKVMELKDYLNENWDKVTSIPNFCTKAMITTLTPVEGVIDDDE